MSGSSYLPDQVADVSPCWTVISQIHTLRLHVWQTRWQIYPPSNGNLIPTLRACIWQARSWQFHTPLWMVISQIPALTAHISFLLWELIFGRPGLGRSTPSVKWQFHRFVLWELIFGRPGGRSTPHQMVISHICTLRAHTWQTRWQIYPPLWNSNFTDSYSWELIFGRPGILHKRPFTCEGNFLIYTVTSIWFKTICSVLGRATVQQPSICKIA